MSFRPSFTEVRKDGDSLVVIGESEAPKEATLAARHVAIQQGAKLIVQGPTDGLEAWRADLRGTEFTLDDALAIGTETYFRGEPASFLTFTWSEIITIT
jgi:hypothetical protein